MAYKQHKGFLPLPAGETRSITVNGTIKSYGSQSPFSNEGLPKGSLGIRSVGISTGSPAGDNTNRTGEDTKPGPFRRI